MKRVLIVSPHFPPSNLVGAQRARLIVPHLPEFGWEPIVVTVHPRHYEEKSDPRLLNLLPKSLRVESVWALPTKPIRLVGNIGFRGFFPMFASILRLRRKEHCDFLWITLCSYPALLGRPVRFLTGMPFGLDFQDPWYTPPSPGERRWSKAWLSRQINRVLEPIAVRHAALITAVAEKYCDGLFARNPFARSSAVFAELPLGAEPNDWSVARSMNLRPLLFEDGFQGFRLTYAGAMLPHAYAPLEAILGAVKAAWPTFESVRFNFIGTGKRPDDPEGFNVKPLAERSGLWGTKVLEHPARIPYLDVLAHLQASDAVFILGSTEPHYTPSKVFEAVLSRKPIFAVLHEASTAVAIIRETGAGTALTFNGEEDMGAIREGFVPAFQEFRRFCERFDPAQVDMERFEAYSARNMAKVLAQALDQALEGSRAQ